MTLRFKSSSPETFVLTGVDPDGRRRSVTATKHSGDFNWQLRLQHPSGRNWQASFHGPNVLDAMSELMVSKDTEFKQDKGRGDRLPAEAFDYNRSADGNAPPITGGINLVYRR